MLYNFCHDSFSGFVSLCRQLAAQYVAGLTKGDGVLPDGPLTAAVGGTVMFTTTVTPPETSFLVVSWSFSFNNTEYIPIITSTSSDTINPEYEGRITLDRSTGSLELRDLALTDSGEYSVSITPNGGFEMRGFTRLEIRVSYSLPAGAIAGIVIACFVVVGGALGGGFYIYKKKMLKKSSPESRIHY
ncbi:hypothetical protein PAMA_015361 [Pampus argenteus]